MADLVLAAAKAAALAAAKECSVGLGDALLPQDLVEASEIFERRAYDGLTSRPLLI